MNPVFLFEIFQTSIKGTWRENQQKVLGLSNTTQQIVVKFAGFKPFYIEKDGKAAQLKMHFK